MGWKGKAPAPPTTKMFHLTVLFFVVVMVSFLQCFLMVFFL